MTISSAKRFIIKVFPQSILHPAAMFLRKVMRFKYRLTMMLFPKRMKVFCPCCGMRFRTFVVRDYKDRHDVFNQSRYAHTRQDVICPVCRALPRHRILAMWSNEHKTHLQSSKILYFAPEQSMMLWMKRMYISAEKINPHG